MSNDVLITPASRKIEFKDSNGNVDAKIETDASGNLSISNTGGDISIGDTSSDVFIGDGTNSVDIVFEQNGEIRGTSGVTLTLGDSNTTLRTGTDLSLNGNDLTNVNNLTITGNLTVSGTTTTLNTSTLQVQDKNIVLNYGTGDTSGSADGAGITIQDAVSASGDAAMTWNASSDLFNFSHKINAQGDVQAYNFYGQDVHVLNTAGTGWHEWATRASDRVNLSVHDIALNGVVTSTNNANSDGPNFNVSTTNKDTAEYAYRVDRSGSIKGGITINGVLKSNTGVDLTGSTSAYVNLNNSGFITFYGNSNNSHAIGARNSSGNVSDDIRINSYGAVNINLDSNSNNDSAADFLIGRHGSGTGAMSQLFHVSGETGNVTSEGRGTFKAGAGGQGLHLDTTSNYSTGTLYAPGLLWRELDGTNIAGIRGFVTSSGNHLALGTGWLDQEVIISSTGVAVAGTISWSGGSSGNANTAYSWGNHASAGYRLASESLYYKSTRESNPGLNLNTAVTPGIYRLHGQASHTGHPTGNGYGFAIILDNSDVHGQLLLDRADSGRLWIRAKTTTSFATSDWNRVWTDADFANNSSNWNTAYSWGNHASAGYLTSSDVYSNSESDNRYLSSIAEDTTTGSLIINEDWNRGTYNEVLTLKGSYPSMAFRSTNANSNNGTVWLFHVESSGDMTFYNQTNTVEGNSWTKRFDLEEDGDLILPSGRIEATYGYFTATGSNTAPSTDDLFVSGYGIMGNRTSPVYVTNSNSGGVEINVGGTHSNGRKAFFASDGLRLYGPSANWNEATQGSTRGALHLDPENGSNNFGSAITWGASDTSNGDTAQAGIYVRSDSNYGTKMYISTTDNYTSGSKTAIQIDQAGHTRIKRGNFYMDAGRIFNIDGGPSTPAYSFINDSDTGIYRNNSNDFGFSTAGASRFRINNDGLAADSNSNIRGGTDSGIYTYHSSIGGFVLKPGGAQYTTNTSTVTGAFKIELPVYASNDMISFWVDIYDYRGGTMTSYFIGGYVYQTEGNNEWVNESAICIAEESNTTTACKQVRFGVQSNKHCIWIGETNTTWSYPQVVVRDFQGGYATNIDEWADGWSITNVTSFGTVDHTRATSGPRIGNEAGDVSVRRDMYLEGNSSRSQIGMKSGGSIRGYFYANNSNEIGILDASGNWGVRHKYNQGTEFRSDGGALRASIGSDLVSGSFGSMVVYEAKSGWLGYSINNRVVFMHDNANSSGIYNDVNNHWMVKTQNGGAVELYHNGSQKLQTTGSGIDVTGNVTHDGLTMTPGTDVDQLYTVTDSLTLTTSWQDTSINSSELATGTYIMQMYAHDNGNGGSHYNEYYSGIISWYGSSTNSAEVDEIVLHRAGHAPNASVIHLRTQRHASGGDNLRLQIKANYTRTAASNYTFKFRRMI